MVLEKITSFPMGSRLPHLRQNELSSRFSDWQLGHWTAIYPSHDLMIKEYQFSGQQSIAD
jgi:hypothetical protein